MNGAPFVIDDTGQCAFFIPARDLIKDPPERTGFAPGFVTVCVTPAPARGGRNFSLPSIPDEVCGGFCLSSPYIRGGLGQNFM